MSEILTQLRALLDTKGNDINAWFADAWKDTPPFFYTSADLRHSGYKLAPVDTNLFPAGFNNLSERSRTLAITAAERTIQPDSKVLIVPEDHTRNLRYLDSLVVLQSIVKGAGAEVKIGTLRQEFEAPEALTSASGDTVLLHPLKREGARLVTQDGFDADVILVNNDMTEGAPALLEGLEQLVTPPLGMGWYRRRKSEHFHSYGRVASQFAEQFGLDPWLISTDLHHCGRIDFMEMKGIECVALGVEKLVTRLKERYAEHGIDEEPYVFIKSDSGTYGMGIMTVRSGDEVFEMNRKSRKKMHAIKGGEVSSQVIIQEGIPTVDMIDGSPCEPMIYLVNGTAVGGAYRVHETRDARSNLNAVGMRFASLCSDDSKRLCMDSLDARQKPECDFDVFGLVSRLAVLAAARENYDDQQDGDEAEALQA